MVLISLGGIYLCFQRLSFIGKRLSAVSGLCAFLRYAKAQVENYSMPCSEIARRCPREILISCGYEKDEPPEDLYELYERVDIADAEAKRIFFDFINDMGSNYRAEQVRRCEEFLALLAERERYIYSRTLADRKLAVALTGSAILALLILLL